MTRTVLLVIAMAATVDLVSRSVEVTPSKAGARPSMRHVAKRSRMSVLNDALTHMA